VIALQSYANLRTKRQGISVLIPGAAGATAIGAIKSLRQVNFKGRIVSFDGEPLSAGFLMSDANYVVPTINQPAAFDLVVPILVSEAIQVILPTSAVASAVFAKSADLLSSLGIVFAGSESNVTDLCDDKLRFWHFVRNNFPVPALIEIQNGQPDTYPCFIKPRFGSGSYGSGLCIDDIAWRYFSSQGEDLVVQEYLPGQEYSVDVLCSLEGIPLVAVPRERISSIGGVSVRSRVVKDRVIQDLCIRMASHLGIKGPCCMQLKRDAQGALKFTEVNPRLGGGSIVASLAGVNLPSLLIAMAAGEPISIGPFREITVVRVLEELIVS